MICQKCGSDISENTVYCLNCGNSVRQQENSFSVTSDENDNGQRNSTNNTAYPGYQNTPNGMYPGYQNTPNGMYPGYQNTPNGTYPGYQNTPNGTYPGYQNTPNGMYPGYQNFYPQQNFGNIPVGNYLPMKWYKFLIYVGLPLGMLYNLGRAISFFTGSDYGDNKELVYAVYKSLQVIDILAGIWALIAMVLGGITIVSMSQRKRKAPLVLYGFQIGNIIVSVIYWLTSYCIVSETFDIPYMIGYLIGYLAVSGVFFLCNFKYFQKRRYLFVH